ncbi:glycosyltransferase [Prosthecobacter sp.]|uniref:glycosyltransferase n=1 Tax=Prosthecobacter sp. TaxID=1965333 RepID=UPI0025CEA3F8|nr:glycosyltransferase [Prosthecobacter sp.]
MGISVLHVIYSFRQGGMENMISQMAWRLSQSGFNVTVCALAGADDFKKRLPPGTPVLELHKRRGLDLRCAMRLRALIRELQPDVIHSHNWNSLVYSLLALGLRRTPLLHGEHALLYGWERSPWRLWLRRLFYARCDIIHTVSHGQVSDMAALGLTRHLNLRVILNGVDTLKFSPLDKAQCRRTLGLPADTPCIGMAARYVPEKRHYLLLKAFEKIASTFPNVRLVLAGAGGNCEAETHALVASHPFADRIIQLGHRDDMTTVYNALDLFVLTSTSEGMSNATLEAMSCGVPVLMNATCGSEELIHPGKNGSLAAMISAKDVAAAVSTLLAQPEQLRTMGGGARTFIEHEYPLAKTAAEYAAVYAALAGKQLTAMEGR